MAPLSLRSAAIITALHLIILSSARVLDISDARGGDMKVYEESLPDSGHTALPTSQPLLRTENTLDSYLSDGYNLQLLDFRKRDSAASTQEPVIGAPTAATSNAQATGPATTDGTCGADNGGTICGDWPQGPCCSQYGFCGDTTDHCGDGCQSGPCLDAPTPPVPGAKPAPSNGEQGQFIIVSNSIVPVMHSALLPNGNLVFLDKVENFTYAKLPSTGQFAYSVEYDPATGEATPLAYETNAFCAGGSFLADEETIISTGGDAPLPDFDPTVGDGFNAIRYLKRTTSGSLNGQDWIENSNKLSSNRWYPTAQILSDGTIFVASGSLNGLDPTVAANNNPTFELLSPQGVPQGTSTPMDILLNNVPYYMYPFVALLKTGDVLVFVSESAQIFQPKTNTVVRSLPSLPGLHRTYPNTGGAQLLALSASNSWEPSFLVCGGGSYQDITSPTDPSCGRIDPLADDPTWEMDAMPEGRVMGEMQLLPDGKLLILNGAGQGSQGFLLGTNPTQQALLYDPDAPLGERFSTLATSTIPRLYHSTVNLLPNGSVLVLGSNPNQMPVLAPYDGAPYATEFRVELFKPPYFFPDPTASWGVTLNTAALTANGMKFTVSFLASPGPQSVTVSLFYPGFNTHSLHMGERVCILSYEGFVKGARSQTLTVTMPPSSAIAPPGGAWLFVLADGVPADMAKYVIVS